MCYTVDDLYKDFQDLLAQGLIDNGEFKQLVQEQSEEQDSIEIDMTDDLIHIQEPSMIAPDDCYREKWNFIFDSDGKLKTMKPLESCKYIIS